MALRPVDRLPHTFDPGRTPTLLRRFEKEPDWRLPALADRYPRCSTDRHTAEAEKLEWVTPGHPLFEAIRRHTLELAVEPFARGAAFYSLAFDQAARIDFYRARVVDGLGRVVHERLFVLEFPAQGEPKLLEPGILGDLEPVEPGDAPSELPAIATIPEATAWLHDQALDPFLQETRRARLEEIERVRAHVELSLQQLLERADEEIGRAATDVEQNVPGAEGRLAQAESRHGVLLARRERRREELERQQSLTLQAVDRLTSVLVLPHPQREAKELRKLKPNPETEATAMRVVMEHERAQGREVFDVSASNLGYDVTSLDLTTGDLRLIEVKGLGATTGTILLTPNERRVAEDRRDCFWLYVVTDCASTPTLHPIHDPASQPWNEVTKVAHYYLSVDALKKPMVLRENPQPFGEQ